MSIIQLRLLWFRSDQFSYVALTVPSGCCLVKSFKGFEVIKLIKFWMSLSINFLDDSSRYLSIFVLALVKVHFKCFIILFFRLPQMIKKGKKPIGYFIPATVPFFFNATMGFASIHTIFHSVNSLKTSFVAMPKEVSPSILQEHGAESKL